ncbi:MAG TPA: hypothetical protein DCE56_16325 [Cyanobacteria bacterium UBA8553]|nr:hypothetical protein [Cyanobacteria bacterium UBA8553]
MESVVCISICPRVRIRKAIKLWHWLVIERGRAKRKNLIEKRAWQFQNATIHTKIGEIEVDTGRGMFPVTNAVFCWDMAPRVHRNVGLYA